MLGFVVAAVSPAVVVPSLLSLQAQGYGTKSGIPTLVVAAAALDDVFSLAGFGVAFSFALPNGAHGRGVLPPESRVSTTTRLAMWNSERVFLRVVWKADGDCVRDDVRTLSRSFPKPLEMCLEKRTRSGESRN